VERSLRVKGVLALVGREAERAEIDLLVERARDGMSGVLVVRGEPGIGKTCLLDAVAASAADFDVVRLVGIESEMRLGFAALHQLLTPYLEDTDSLPPPQARALKAAFGMSADVAPDPFLVGLAALTLLTAAATRRPLLLVVDDTQWLDQESADALGFVARRLYADRMCVLVAMRDSAEHRHLFDGLSSLTLAPLSEGDAVELLDAAVAGPLADHVRARLLADARGNPLALVELGRELSLDQLAGSAQLPAPLAVDQRLERHFLRQVGELPPATQRLLLVAAAEPTGDVNAVWQAGRELDFDEGALVPAQAAGLLERGPDLAFRHPLIRSAVYQGADPADRCRAHEVLAAASDPEMHPDRRAWHRAAAAQVPDEDVAVELEQAAQRAGSRGSCAASAALLARAAQLTPDRGTRSERLLRAAAADLTAGSAVRARANLALARPDLHDPVLVAQARQLEATIAYVDSVPGSTTRTAVPGHVGEIVSIMVESARALEPRDLRLARGALLDTIPMAIYFGHSSAVSAAEVATIVCSWKLPPGTELTAADRLVDAIADLFAHGYRSAAPLLRDALDAAKSDPEMNGVLRHMSRACWLAFALSDYDALALLASTCATSSREQGAYQVLPEVLDYLAQGEIHVGSLNVAEELYNEVVDMHVVLRREGAPAQAGQLIVSAWRGRESEVRRESAALAARAGELGLVVRLIDYALIVLELGLGNYQAASALSRPDWNEDLSWGALRAADTVEANVRSADLVAARVALEYLAERAAGNESALDLGLLARAQAFIAEGAEAEERFGESIARLEKCGARLHLARSQLVYGEWLRRQKRRRDARVQLEAARETFDAMGVHGFAERARIELLATGAQARKRVDETRDDLTPQESQIARLAVGGSTNPEIAARLFISANTVDYHLRKVYRKLDIKSRHELAGVLPGA
jgi:DNA-binding CsgD family transcriptional regulator